MIDAILVEDQPTIREGLKNMLALYASNITIIGEAESVKTGTNLINAVNADLLFLDIEMKDGNAFDLIKSLTDPIPHIIFVTAHDKYAVDAFKLSAVDYLLKPIDKDDLLNAIEKVKFKIQHQRNDYLQVLVENIASVKKKIVLKDVDNIHVVEVVDIIRCEAEGSYTIFHTKENRKIVISKTLKEYDMLLSPYGFIRVHHSHLVNVNEIKRFNKTQEHQVVMSNGDKLPVSFRKKDQLIQRLSELGI
ncbi:MAG: response regulator transcription factor [Cyclobacteriaceae bacterium]|nr:response regulator transcription factor [Cyclobacteriaceae bacterium]